MFTEEQIIAAQAKVKSGADFPNLIQELKSIGVRSYDHIVSDHSNHFYGDDGHSVIIRHSQAPIPVATEPSSQKLKHTCLSISKARLIIRRFAYMRVKQGSPNGQAIFRR